MNQEHQAATAPAGRWQLISLSGKPAIRLPCSLSRCETDFDVPEGQKIGFQTL
jgi:hypothetical protein